MKLLLLLLITNAVMWTSDPTDEVVYSAVLTDENYRCRYTTQDIFVCRSILTGEVKTKYQVNI